MFAHTVPGGGVEGMTPPILHESVGRLGEGSVVVRCVNRPISLRGVKRVSALQNLVVPCILLSEVMSIEC